MDNEMLARDVLALAYKAFDGEMRGKTLLQKRVYFLSVMLGIDMGYEAHYYGPYSAQVASLNAELKSLGYISELSSAWGYDQRGFEMTRYHFELTEIGGRIAGRKAEKRSELWSRVQRAASVVKEAGELDYMELSIAAKAYYVLNKLNGKATLEGIAGMLPKFGWSVTNEQLDKATDFLAKAKLVTKG
ncbi:MAG: hypothetical protein NT090_00080 [Acidobacteria bacterium]|nr:hypothetical protein [Acidobacteriota bacterium]